MVKGNKTKVVKTQTINLKADGAKSAAITKDPAKVLVNLIKQQRSLYSKNIGDWLAGRATAEKIENPNRSKQYDLYDDIILDEFVHGQIYNHRILPVKNRSFKIVNAKGEKDEEKTNLLKRRWFDEYIEYALESKFFGFSLIYLDEMVMIDGRSDIKNVVLVPRRHVLQESGLVLNKQADTKGQNYLEQPLSNYCLPIGKPFDLGLLNKAAPLWILKKHAWQNWDEFAEIFGIPIRVVKTASQDPRVIAEIEEWVREMGTAAYGIFPDGTEIDIKENSKTDAFGVFHEMIKSANEGLAILFSGQTMTSMDGSSRSQAEVHQDVAFEIRKDDEKFLQYAVADLLEVLRLVHNYPFDEGDRFEWDVPEDVKALMDVFKAVNAMGFQLDPEEVSSRLGVKILGLKTPEAAAPGDDDKEETESELAAKKILKLHAEIADLYSGGVHV